MSNYSPLKSTTTFCPADPRLYRVADLQVMLARASESTSDPSAFVDALVSIAQCAAVAELIVSSDNTTWESLRDKENWETIRKNADTILARYKERFAPMMPAQRNLVTVPLTEQTKAKLVAKRKVRSSAISEEMKQKIVYGYADGLTGYQLAEKFGYGHATIYRILKEAGIDRRPRGSHGE